MYGKPACESMKKWEDTTQSFSYIPKTVFLFIFSFLFLGFFIL